MHAYFHVVAVEIPPLLLPGVLKIGAGRGHCMLSVLGREDLLSSRHVGLNSAVHLVSLELAFSLGRTNHVWGREIDALDRNN